jgi:DNA-binding GntR family transcriptional regulator
MALAETPSAAPFAGRRSLSQEVAALIKKQMVDGVLNPGDRIVETKLAKELGLSQTPIREAIRQLSGEGIITIVPNKGPVVQTLTQKDIFEIYSIRAVLEGLAMRMATQVASAEEIEAVQRIHERMVRKLHDDSVTSLLRDSAHLHASIVALSKHSRLIATYESVSFQISLVNRILARVSTKQKEVDQHRELVEALAGRDPEHAERTMRAHIYRSYQEFTELEDTPSTDLPESLWF